VGIRNPRFAPSFTADLLLCRGAKHIKRRTAFEGVPNAELATAKTKTAEWRFFVFGGA